MMSKVAGYILKVGGTAESRIIPIVSGPAGMISSFMQNVGAAALLLPVVSRISSRSGLPMSRLLMPMGFTAILGGTIQAVQTVADAVKQAFEAPGIMIAQLNGEAAGQTVFHMPFQIMPRFKGLEFKLHAREMEDFAVLERHAELIRSCLEKG